MNSRVWLLTAPDGTELGRLSEAESDMFWTECHFTPTPAFSRVAPLFAAERELLERDEMEAWEAAHAKIDALALELRPADGGESLREFLLHVEGEHARLRY